MSNDLIAASGVGTVSNMRIAKQVIAVMLIVLVVASTCEANSNFIAFMNARVGTWKHTGKQTGPESMEWTTTEVVTRRGLGSSAKWKSNQRIVFTDGVVRNDVMTTGLMKGGGWYTEGTYGDGRYYRDGKLSLKQRRYSHTGRKTMKVNYRRNDGYRQTATTTIISPKRYRSIIGTASDGTRTVINARKVR